MLDPLNAVEESTNMHYKCNIVAFIGVLAWTVRRRDLFAA